MRQVKLGDTAKVEVQSVEEALTLQIDIEDRCKNRQDLFRMQPHSRSGLPTEITTFSGDVIQSEEVLLEGEKESGEQERMSEQGVLKSQIGGERWVPSLQFCSISIKMLPA